MSGWHVDAQCVNHFMHVNDIFLLAPNAIGLQLMLDACFEFSIRNVIKFNLVLLYLLFLNVIVMSGIVQISDRAALF